MKILKNTIFVILFFFIGQWVLVQLANYSIEKSKFRFSKLYTRDMHNQMIAVGNSRAVNSFHGPFIQDKYDLKAMNLAYNGMSGELTLLICKDYLERQAKPSSIFIEISTFLKKEDKENNINSQFNLYASFSSNIDSLLNQDFKSRFINLLFPLYQFNNQLWLRNLYYLKGSDQYWINNYQITPEIKESISTVDPFDLSINQNEIAQLKNFIKLCDEQGIEVICYLAPYHPLYINKMQNLDKLIQIVSSQIQHPIIDLSNAFSEDEFFADRVHTNVKGAKALSNALLQVSLRER